jgi:uncharacterized protein
LSSETGAARKTDTASCVAQSLNKRIAALKNVLEPVHQTSEKQVTVPPPISPAPASNQAADCSNAIGIVDRAVCNDATLSHWEDRLGKLYQQALDDPSLRPVLANDQKRWIGERTDTCGAQPPAQMTDCVLQMTKRRIEEFVQFIISRDEPQDRSAKVEKILIR